MPKSDQGVFNDRYQVIPRTLIFVTKGDQLLLLKGAPTKKLWANKYNGVGGHIEKGEDVLSAAERELAEETGLRTNGLWLCGTLIVDTGENTGIAIYILKGEYLRGEITASQEGLAYWASSSEYAALPLVEDLNILLPKVLKIKPGDRAFFGRSYYDEADNLRVDIRD
jgi:8-oxo-dGTP diphosphatase